MRATLAFSLSAILLAPTTAPAQLHSRADRARTNATGDAARAVLEVRANRPAPAGRPEALFTHPFTSEKPLPGHRLFHMVGADNAECVRSIPDINGDGRDEVLVGIGKSGTDNVFCLDGASQGSAAVLWKLQTMSGVSGGSCWGDQSIEVVSDTEGNQYANALVGTAWGGRTAHNFDTLAGAELWKFDTYLDIDSGWVYSLCEISDVTGDGVPEYAFGVGSGGNAAILVDGASAGAQAEIVWRYAAGDAVYSVRNLGDIDGDGTDDVLAAAGDNADRILCLEGDSTLPGGNVLWSYAPSVGVRSCGVLSDVNRDGVDEALAVLWTTDGSAIRCLDGATGAPLWSSASVFQFGMAVDELGDVTGDGVSEVVVASWENAAIVLDGSDGGLLWKRTVGTQNGGDVWTARGIGDLDSDGWPDVIAGSFDYHVYAFSGRTGHALWAYNTGNRVFSVYPVGDLNGDGHPEVVAGTQDTTSNVVVHVLDGDGRP